MDDLVLIDRKQVIDAIMSVKRTDSLQRVAMLIMDLPSAEPQEHKGEMIHSLVLGVPSVERVLTIMYPHRIMCIWKEYLVFAPTAALI